MFCSQFVYRMLRLAGLHYFRKDPLPGAPPWTLWTWMPRGPDPGGGLHRVGGRLLAPGRPAPCRRGGRPRREGRLPAGPCLWYTTLTSY